MKKRVVISIAILLLHVSIMRGLIIGSEIAVSVESLVTFPEIDLLNDNIIRAFAWMKNGFKLENSDTDLEFQSTYPVLGTVDLRGGTLTLDQDLIFKNVTTLDGLGTILGQGHIVHFSSSIKKLPTNTKVFDQVNIFFDDDLTVQSQITFTGDCSISGNNNKLILDQNAALIIGSNSSLHLRNLDLTGVQDGKIYCADDTGQLVLDTISWIQDSDISFTLGSITFADQVTFSGTGTFLLSTMYTSTIEDGSTWTVTENLTLNFGKHATNLAEPLYFETSNAVLYLDNIRYIAPPLGVTLTRGLIIFNRDVTLDLLGTTTQTGALLGNGDPDEDIRILLNPGSTVKHQSGYWTYNNGQKDRLEADSTSAKLIREEGSNIYIAKDLELQRTTLQIVSTLVPPIIVEPSATLSYHNSVVRLPEVEFDIKANQLSSFVYQLDGNDTIFFTRGNLPLALLITGAGNVLRGSGGMGGPITFSNNSSELTIGLTDQVRDAMTLNNGTLILDAPLGLDSNGIINGPGTVNLSKYLAELSRTVEVWPTSILWQATDGEIDLFGSLSLLDTWTISGELTLHGNGNILDLGSLGNLLVTENSTLILKDIEISGVQGNNIRCIDDTGMVHLFNAHLILDADYSFTVGQMFFEQENSFEGKFNFSYETAQTSTIAMDSSLTLKGGLNFKIGRKTVNSLEPIIFTDKTSELILDQATLNVQPFGLNLTKGKFIINRDSTFDINSTHTGIGLKLGNGIADEDITVQLNPGCTLDLKKGHIVYNLADKEEGFVSQSQTARVKRGALFVTHFMRDAQLSNITFELTPPALFTVDPGIDVTFSKVLAVTPGGQFELTGRRISIQEIALDGNNSLEIKTGLFPSILTVSGTGNSISGAGSTANITRLADSATQLTSSLSGSFLQTVQLNNGLLNIGGSGSLGGSTAFTGPGTVNLTTKTLEFGDANSIWATPLLWTGTSGVLGFHANVSLESTWTVSGNINIKGHGFSLDLNSNAGIEIANNSILHLEGLKVKNLSGNKIKCLGDNSVLVLDGVTIELGGNFHFTTGAICIKNKVTVDGNHYIFGYETNQTSTIHSEAQWKFDESSTFSYDPSSLQDNLIEFLDDTGRLVLNNADLITTSTSLHFKKGVVEIRGESSFAAPKERQVDGSFKDPGIIFGDGSTSTNDTRLFITLGSLLKINSGSVIYNNVSADSFMMGNRLSRVSLVQDTSLHLLKNLDMGSGVILLERGAQIIRSSNALLTGSVFEQ